MDAIGITAITLVVTLLALCEILIVWGVMDRRRKRALPTPQDQPGMTISFDSIAYKVGKREILQNVTGAIRPGELLAIMGPSGTIKVKVQINVCRIG